MKKLFGSKPFCVISVFGILLIMTFGLAHAQETDFTPPTITFKKLDKDGCKIFEIDGGDGGQIKKVNVFSIGSIEKPPTIAPPAKRTSDAMNDEFEYGKPPGLAELKVCPKKGEKNVVFSIDVETTKELDMALVVQELETKAGKETSGEIIATFSIGKNNAKCDSLKIKGDNFEEKEKTKCLTGDKGTIIVVNGNQKDLNKPAITAISIDPPNEMHLMVIEACIMLEDEITSCPRDITLDFEIEFPIPIAGKLLPTDFPALFLAGLSQSAVWMIPTLAGIAGAGVILRSKLHRD